MDTKSNLNIYRFKPFRLCECSYSKRKPYPKPRSGHRIVCDGETNIYCYGGYNPATIQDDPDLFCDPDWKLTAPLFKEVWKFNISTAKWKKLTVANTPMDLVSSAVLLSTKYLLVFGGTRYPFGSRCSNTLHMCDLSKDDLEFHCLQVEGNLPTPQYGQGIVLDGEFFYTVGGTSGYRFSMDIHRLNVRTKVWELYYTCTGGEDEPTGRYRHELAFDGTKIYLLGGGTIENTEGFEEVPVFDTIKKEWITVKTYPDENVSDNNGFPMPRKYHSCVQVEFKVVITGGSSGSDSLKDSWILNLRDLRWNKLTDMDLPTATHFHSGTLTPSGKMYTYGGVIQGNEGSERTDKMYSAWMRIPSLKEMCWDAAIHYKLPSKLGKVALREIGVPMEYLDRID